MRDLLSTGCSGQLRSHRCSSQQTSRINRSLCSMPKHSSNTLSQTPDQQHCRLSFTKAGGKPFQCLPPKPTELTSSNETVLWRGCFIRSPLFTPLLCIIFNEATLVNMMDGLPHVINASIPPSRNTYQWQLFLSSNQFKRRARYRASVCHGRVPGIQRQNLMHVWNGHTAHELHVWWIDGHWCHKLPTTRHCSTCSSSGPFQIVFLARVFPSFFSYYSNQVGNSWSLRQPSCFPSFHF